MISVILVALDWSMDIPTMKLSDTAARNSKSTASRSIVDREIIHWQLHFIGMPIGNGSQLDLTDNAYCGLMHIFLK